jgi:hypothetical protein
MARPAIFKRIEKSEGNALAAAVIAFAVASAFYLATMSHTYGFIDRGELAAVASTLGIAHPTGYPTLTLLGHLTVKLFPFFRPVLVLNALSALWTASGVALTVLAIDKVLRMASMTSIQGSQQASFWSATFVAFSTTWWSQATGFEVYSLHAVFLTLVTLTFFKYLDECSPPPSFASSSARRVSAPKGSGSSPAWFPASSWDFSLTPIFRCALPCTPDSTGALRTTSGVSSSTSLVRNSTSPS